MRGEFPRIGPGYAVFVFNRQEQQQEIWTGNWRGKGDAWNYPEDWISAGLKYRQIALQDISNVWCLQVPAWFSGADAGLDCRQSIGNQDARKKPSIRLNKGIIWINRTWPSPVPVWRFPGVATMHGTWRCCDGVPAACLLPQLFPGQADRCSGSA